MDYDIDMGDALETFPHEEASMEQDILPVDDAQEPGEIDESPNDVPAESRQVNFTKIHIRGIDVFKPEDLKAYVRQYFSSSQFDRVEWIDDSSANLVFPSESTTAEAIVALSAVDIADPSQLEPLEFLPAKPFAEKPDAVLQIRYAVASDRKERGAAARSRFYLLNPEYDPAERRRHSYRDRDGEYRDRSRRNGGRRRERYDDDVIETFDASLYDDDAEALAKRESSQQSRRFSRSGSRSSSTRSDRHRRPDNSLKELFPGSNTDGRRSTRLRDRSASPVRSDHGDVSMGDTRERGAATRNREGARSIKERLAKELAPRELFPSKHNSPKELFPSAGPTKSNAAMDQLRATDTVTTRLSDRITRPSETGFSIKGIASQRYDNQGFSIKGHASAKELFPDKLNNSGKELFSEKLANRIRRPRQRAEDSWS